MLTNEELYFSEVAWLGELEIKDCGREIIQNQNRAKGNKSNKLLSEGGAHTSPFQFQLLPWEEDAVSGSVPSPGQDERDLFFPCGLVDWGSPYALKH